MNVNLTHSVTRFTLIWVFCLLFSTTTALRLRTVTFNTGGILRDTTPFNDQLSRQLPDLLVDQDVVIFNFQEVYEQKAISAIINSARFNKKTVNNALEENFINLLIPEDERANYTVQSHFCFAFLTLIVARNSFLGDNGIDLYSETIHVDVFNEGAYHGGHWGGFFLSKGGFSILISLGDLRIININCHLNSKNKKKREEEWNALKTTLIKYYYRTLYGTDNDGDLAENHDNLDRQANLIWLWSGDFNPRFDKKDLTAIKHNVKQFYLEDDDLNNPDLLNAPLTLDEEHDYIEWLPKLLRFDEFILRREKNNRELEGLA